MKHVFLFGRDTGYATLKVEIESDSSDDGALREEACKQARAADWDDWKMYDHEGDPTLSEHYTEED